MELRQLKNFVSVADELNFSRAAEKLFIAQPALSRQVQQLEEELGALLFHRDKRNVKLTPAGEYLYEHARQLLGTARQVAAQTQRIHRGLVGELHIGHPGSAMYSVLPDALARFTRQFPDVVTSLDETAELQLVEALRQQRIDVGLSREGNTDPHLADALLFAEPFALVVPDDHWLTTATFQHLGQCIDEPFILPTTCKSIHYGRKLMAMFERHGFSPRPVYESNIGATILRLVEKHLGLAVLPITYQNGNSLRLRFIPLPDQSELFLLWRRDDPNPVLHNFVAICREVAQEPGRHQPAG